ENFHMGDGVDPGFEAGPELDYAPPVGPGEPVFHSLPGSRVMPGLESMGDYVGAYDSALARLDWDLEHLLKKLGEKGILGRTTVVLVGGYGMGFGEAGLMADAGTLSEVDLAVPLLIRPAPELEFPVGNRIPAVVSLVDLGPTLMHMHQVQLPPDLAGRSLAGLMLGNTDSVRDFAFAIGDIHAGFAVIDDRGMFVHSLPQVGGPPDLGTSWFGSVDQGAGPVEVLLPRGEGLRPDAYRAGVGDGARASELRAAGEAWAQNGQALRDMNFETPGGAGRVNASGKSTQGVRPAWLVGRAETPPNQ
ncbi:MAG: sulfatase-like hydrolase/transferase, partial [Planctomycetota bacterium]|nr:sulfatase-like hydrolase/transferase [Planctomycetota bacterium]